MVTNASEVPIQMIDCGAGTDPNFPWPELQVPVWINAQGPFQMGLEFQRGRTIIRAEAFPGLVQSSRSAGAVILDSARFPLIVLDSLAIGSAVRSNFVVMLWGTPVEEAESGSPSASSKVSENSGSPPANLDSSEWKGILGFDFLRQFEITFNFKKNTVTFAEVAS